MNFKMFSVLFFEFSKKIFGKKVKNKLITDEIESANNDAINQCSASDVQIDVSSNLCDQRSTLANVDRHLPSNRSMDVKIMNCPENVNVLCGDTMSLQIEFAGSANVQIDWIKRERRLTSSVDSRISVRVDACTAILEIRGTMETDSGKYTVKASDGLSSDSRSVSVNVKSCPERPFQKPVAKQISNNCILISWNGPNFDGGSVVTSYLVEMKYGNENKWSQICSTQSLSCNYSIAGENSNNEYVFRVKAVNCYGTSEPSLESDAIRVLVYEDQKEEETISADSKMDSEHKEVFVEDGSKFGELYKIDNEIGRGRFGVVYRCTNLSTNTQRAAKFIRCIKEKDKEKIREEIEIMNKLKHPKLLQLEAAYQTRKEMILVMEYVPGGELFERIIADDFILTEFDCIQYMRQILEGVNYMHTNYVMHLDLKPENIVCQTKNSHRIKIIDFGLARIYDPKVESRVLFGTPEFVAPEVIQYEPISPKADLWSLGVICYILLSGLSPFAGDTDAETFSNVIKVQYDFEDDAFDNISENAKNFISHLLCKKPDKRLTAEQCLSHEWLSEDEQRQKTRANIQLSTDKLKKFYYRRKWQKSGNAIRALGRLTLFRDHDTNATTNDADEQIESDQRSKRDTCASISQVQMN